MHPHTHLSSSTSPLPCPTQAQTIGFLSHLKQHSLHGPFMVVGPLSTLPNWITEFQRFCPSLPVLLYHGSKQEREKLRRDRLRLHSKRGDL